MSIREDEDDSFIYGPGSKIYDDETDPEIDSPELVPGKVYNYADPNMVLVAKELSSVQRFEFLRNKLQSEIGKLNSLFLLCLQGGKFDENRAGTILREIETLNSSFTSGPSD